MPNKHNIPVYLLNPSYIERNIDFYNLGIVSIASHLKRNGISVNVYMNYLDFKYTAKEDYDSLLPTLLSNPAMYIGISCMTAQLPSALSLTKRIKEISPETVIVWGGPHVNVYAKHMLQEYETIDYCIRGFGERPAELLYRYLDNGKSDIKNIPGLVYRNNGRIIENNIAQPQQDIYNQPMDFALISNFNPVERYFAGIPAKEVPIFNSIGCPFRCRFCINSMEQSKIILRDLDVVIQEIKQVLAKGVDTIFFIDEMFFMNFERLDKFLERISEEKLDFSWFAHARVDTISREKLNKDRLLIIRDRGCKELHFGIESGSQRILDCINKKIKVEHIIPAWEKVIEANIIPKGSFIFGMPGETVEDVRRTIYLIIKLAEHFEGRCIIMNYFYYPIPGTVMTEESFMSINAPDKVKIDYCIEAAQNSGHPYKLFRHFDKKGFYDWIPDKKLFAELWFIARVISDICTPYKFRKGYKPMFNKWSIDVSPETCSELIDNCSEGEDKSVVIKWLDKVKDYVK